MRWIGGLQTEADIIAYNLRDGGHEFTVFADAQPERVAKAREIISGILGNIDGRAGIIELGCSAGDISGHFSEDHDVLGIDVVPGAITAAHERYPRMALDLVQIESVPPLTCDILVLCEILEHVIDPIALVRAWLPRAKYVVIGHPLVADGRDPEAGHVWAYTDDDYRAWFPMGGHDAREAWGFEMAGYRMVLGWGERRG